jgi:hypothetical protein
MRVPIAIGAVGSLLMLAVPAWAQTKEIEKQVGKKLEAARKEQAGLDAVFAEALKNNPDIRVAEAKLREAEAELYRVRVNVLNRVVILRHDIRSAKAAADEARSRYEREKALAARGGSGAADLSAAFAAAEKYLADLAVKQAELDLLIGKPHGKGANAPAKEGADRQKVAYEMYAPAEALLQRATASPAMVEKIRKALDVPLKIETSGKMAPSKFLEWLREQTRGVNIVGTIEDDQEVSPLKFAEPVPLGAIYQWAEDQLGWRFVVRDYGIVAAAHESLIPPGAALLKDIWPPRVKPRDANAK